MKKTILAAGLTVGLTGVAAVFDGGGFEVRAYQDLPKTMPVSLFTDASGAHPAATHAYSASMNAFVVRDAGRVVVIDTGNGLAAGGRFLSLLVADGIRPEDVTDILITHFHSDHTGGLLLPSGAAAFPSARLYVPEAECRQNPASARAALAVYGARVTRFTPGDATKLPCGFTAIAAPGHTPGHVIYAKGDIDFAGDFIHAADLQFANPDFCAAWDADPAAARASRKAEFDRAISGRRLVAGVHIPAPGVVTLSRRPDGAVAWAPVPAK